MGRAFLKRASGPLVGFVLGAAAAVLVGAVLGPSQPAGHARRIVENWGISEETPGQLVVDLVYPRATLVRITREADNEALQGIAVVDEHIGTMFSYDIRGDFGAPQASYGGGSPDDGITWTDLNLDGRFDKRVDFARQCAEIRVSGRWVRATIENGGGAETADGEFEFAPESGEWRLLPDRELEQRK